MNPAHVFTIALEIAGLMLAIFGALIVLYSGTKAAYHYMREAAASINNELNVDHIRLEFGRDIVLALDFFVAADLMQTVIIPDYYEIGLLAALVGIRTVLSYFLRKEVEELAPHERQKLR